MTHSWLIGGIGRLTAAEFCFDGMASSSFGPEASPSCAAQGGIFSVAAEATRLLEVPAPPRRQVRSC
jgi:hypothetical protein